MPLGTGMIFTGLSRRTDDSPLYIYLAGLMTLLAVFQLIAIPLSLRRTSLTLLTRSFLIAGAILCVAGIVISILRHRIGTYGKWIKSSIRRFTPLLVVVIVCILLQMLYVTKYQHIDEDDAYYLGTAVTAVQKDGLYRRNPYTGRTITREDPRYILASWPLFTAMLSQVSGVQATKLAHMVFPAIILFWCYLVWFLLARWLYPDRPDKSARFVFFVTLLHTFAGYSIYNAQVFVLIRSWQGKAILAGVGLPALVYLCLRAFWAGGRTSHATEEKSVPETGTGTDAVERAKPSHPGAWSIDLTVLTIAVAGLTCFTTISSIFSVIIAGCFGICAAWRDRTPRHLIHVILVCLPAFICSGLYLVLR